jgi:class 3 adenylate cyclase/tetratricopeptide (TPR) repeat protein
VSTDRTLATVLFTDIVGSTERAAELEDQAWSALLNEHHAHVRRELRRYGGLEVNTIGDGFVARFDSPARAIACAWSIRDAVRELGLEIRGGLHMGQIQTTGRELGGLAMHIGARVAARAEPGEILVSSTIRDAEAGSGFRFQDRGLHDLKGVPGEWRLFAVTAVPEAAKGPLRRASPAFLRSPPLRLASATAVVLLVVGGVYFFLREGPRGLTPEEVLAKDAAPGMAVLPFAVRGAGLDIWREGMVDVLSTNLDGAAGLRAIDSRTVLARWRESVKGQEAPDLATALEVAQQTGARYAVLGEAVAAGPDVRFSGTVYEAKTGTKLGQGQVEGSPDSIFKLVDRFSIEILRATLRDDKQAIPALNLARITTTSPAALKDFLEGESFYRRSNFEHAIPAYRRAVAADSTFALAFYRLGNSLGWVQGGTSEDAKRQLEWAGSLANRLPAREAFLVRSASLSWVPERLDGLDSLRQGVKRYPDDPEMWHELGDVYFHRGPERLIGPHETEAALLRGMELDPTFSPSYLHPLQMAVGFGDLARAERLTEAFERQAASPSDERLNRIMLQLVSADSSQRALAQTALSEFSSWDLVSAFDYLGHPRFRAAEEALIGVLAEREGLEEAATRLRFWFFLGHGRVRAALEQLDDPSLTERAIADGLYTAAFMDMPVPRERLDSALAIDSADSALTIKTFVAGAYAADHARWADFDSVRARVRRHGSRSLAAGDSTAVRFAKTVDKALEGFGLWKRGRAAEAETLLEAAFRDAPGRLNWHLRWILGELFLDMKRPKEAASYFESFWPCGCAVNDFALSYWFLGKAYEDAGEFAKARAAYELFDEAWQEADPELQPLVVQARAAMTRLGGPRRE